MFLGDVALTRVQGQFFPFFVVALLLLVLLPVTYQSFVKKEGTSVPSIRLNSFSRYQSSHYMQLSKMSGKATTSGNEAEKGDA